jgi:hypothetical protein
MESFELKTRGRLLEGSIFKSKYFPIGKENGSMHSTDLGQLRMFMTKPFESGLPSLHRISYNLK